MKRTPRPMKSGEEEKLELVEQTMKKVAAEPDADIALLSRLDLLRAEVRQAVRRGSRKSGHA